MAALTFKLLLRAATSSESPHCSTVIPASLAATPCPDPIIDAAAVVAGQWVPSSTSLASMRQLHSMAASCCAATNQQVCVCVQACVFGVHSQANPSNSTKLLFLMSPACYRAGGLSAHQPAAVHRRRSSSRSSRRHPRRQQHRQQQTTSSSSRHRRQRYSSGRSTTSAAVCGTFTTPTFLGS